MSFFARIEEACAAFIERAFAKTFPSDLEPAQIARKLVATMEAQATAGVDGVYAPHHYLVRVNAADHARLAPHREYLEQEWNALLVDMARRVHVQFTSSPEVILLKDPSIVGGAVEIDASLEESVSAEPLPALVLHTLRVRVAKGTPRNAVANLVGSVTIGRGDDSDLVLTDLGISRHHACVRTADGVSTLVDLHSTNGSFLNGIRVEQARICSGDVVTLGNTQLAVEEIVQ